MDLARACEPLIKPQEACKILGVNMNSLRNYVKARKFPTYQLSKRCFRFRRSEIEDFINNNIK
jgi:predicted DNA-binding transcriptional regulator AlpA